MRNLGLTGFNFVQCFSPGFRPNNWSNQGFREPIFVCSSLDFMDCRRL
jgi:hypothetical protein